MHSVRGMLRARCLLFVDEVLFLDGAPFSLDAYFGASVRLAPFIVVECPAVLIVAAVLRALRCPILILSMTGVVIVLSTSERWDQREQHREQDRTEETSISVGHCRSPMLKGLQLIVRHARRCSGDGVDSVLGVTQPGLGVVRNQG
jgi:hypothetical protein